MASRRLADLEQTAVLGDAARCSVATGLRPAHEIWLMRRASLLTLRCTNAHDPSPDVPRSVLFRTVASKVASAVEGGTELALTLEERAELSADVGALVECAEREMCRPAPRDLDRAEEWLRIAWALREVIAASRVTRDPQ